MSNTNHTGVGRPRAEIPEKFPEYYVRWKKKEVRTVDMLDVFSLSKTTFYRLVERHEKDLAEKQLAEDRKPFLKWSEELQRKWNEKRQANNQSKIT